MKERGSSFSGSIGFVLAAAGSAVGVGNIWRFPYLCAKDGGGLFLLVYLVLVLTFGFVLLTTDVALGRKTKKNALRAFESLDPKWKFLGHLTFMVPALIMTYYSVIGGWIVKYFFTYIISEGKDAASDVYFTSFITSDIAPVVFMLIFLALTAWIVFRGVEKGIEKFSRIIMPGLILLIVIIAIFSLTLSHTDTDGTVRTGMQGLAVYLKPDFHGLTVKRFLEILLDAMSQLFFSLSVSMGIMITYGSYLRKQDHIEQSVRQIEVFDTLVAFLAGLMIVPAVFVYSGGDESALGKGPSLMFVTLPKVFAEMKIGSLIGAGFFILVLFAALTSSVSVMEAIVSGLDDRYHWGRKKATVICYIYAVALGICCSLGFGKWSSFTIFGFSILDFLDFVSNSLLMPVVGMLTCIMVGFVLKPQLIVNELELNGPFKMKKFYSVMVKWIAPPCLLAILISSILDTLGIVKL